MDILVRSLLNKGGMQDLMTVYMQDEFLPWRLTIDAEDGLFFQQLAEHIGERLPDQLTLYPVNAVVLTTHWAVVLHLLYLAGCATRDRFRSFIMNPAPGTSVSVSPVCSQKTSTTHFAQARRQDVSAESYVVISDDELACFDFAHAQTQESYILISDDEVGQAQSSEHSDVTTYGDGHQLSAVQVRLLRLAHGSSISASSETRTTFEGEALNDFELFEQFVGGNCNASGGQCQGPDQFLQHPEMLLDNVESKSKRRRRRKAIKKLQAQPQTDHVG